MAASTASALWTLGVGLRRIYSDDTFEYAQNAAGPLVERFDELEEVTPEGDGYYWPFMLASPQNYSTPAEDGNIPVPKQREQIEGRLRPGSFVGDFEITFMLEAIGTARGGWNKGEVKRHSFDTLADLVKHRNRIYAGTFNTGMIAKVQATVAASNQWTAQMDTTGNGSGWAGTGHGAQLLRKKQNIEIYSALGVLKMASRTITALSNTRLVTMSGASDLALDPGDEVYIAGSYGQATVPNGLMGLVDDNEFARYIHNADRTLYSELNSLVFRGTGNAIRAVNEDMLISGGFLLRHLYGGELDLLVSNLGQWHKLYKSLAPTRYVEVTGGMSDLKRTGGVPSSDTFRFFFDGRPVDILVSEDIAPRHVYGLDLSTFRKVTLRKLGWLDQGGGNIFAQGVDTGGYKTTRVATMYSIENIGCLAPWRNCRWQDLSDPLLCGPTFAGTDTL
jgi:hypothetical protein